MKIINKKIIILVSIMFLVLVSLFAIIKVINYNNIKSISYNGRIYIKSTRELNAKDIENIKSDMNTGKVVKDMEIYDVNKNSNNPTVIFLKTKDGKFLVYNLSDGP